MLFYKQLVESNSNTKISTYCLKCSFNTNEIDILTENVRSKVKIEISLQCTNFQHYYKKGQKTVLKATRATYIPTFM